jgi:hypothetical protein
MKDMRERLEDAFPDWSDDAVDPKRVVAHSGTLANRPAVADANAGEIYVATDTGGFFRFDGTAWLGAADSTSLIYAIYDDAQGGGSKVTSEGVVDQIVSVNISGTTNAFGVVTFDIGELGLVTAGLDLTKSNVHVATGQAGGTAFARVDVSPVGPSTVSVFFYDYAGVAYGSQAVVANLIFFLSE